ncbi:hypothetical protein [Nocardia sp. CNY236]|uniref:hypothetical protein n=1 Tax=Nocardia sp. CNY236 TaxID=1169152 RepID=UPI00055C0476
MGSFTAAGIAVIAQWLVHADSAFTMRTYVHSQSDALAATAGTLDAVVTKRRLRALAGNVDVGGNRLVESGFRTEPPRRIELLTFSLRGLG